MSRSLMLTSCALCYPAPPGDSGCERIKAQNVGALVPRYRGAGAHCVIVNGVLDPLRRVHTELMPHAGVTVCRLRAEADEIADRFTGRHGTDGDLDELLRETLDAAVAMAQSRAKRCSRPISGPCPPQALPCADYTPGPSI
jgi:hypothetical protein